MSDHVPQTQSLEAAINAVLHDISTNPEKAVERLEAHKAELEYHLDCEADQYNHLIDVLNTRDESIENHREDIKRLESALKLAESTDTPESAKMRDELTAVRAALSKAESDYQAEINSLLQQLNNHRDLHSEEMQRAQSRIGQLDTKVKKLESQHRADQKELKEYRELNPKRLSTKNRELKKLNADQKQLINEMSGASNALFISADTLKKKVSLLEQLVANREEYITDLRKRLDFNDGGVEKKLYRGKDGLTASIHSFCWGLTTKAVDPLVKTVSGLDWHLEVRTNLGIGVIISFTDWLVPIGPVCQEVKDRWPEDINDELENIIVERCKTSHPYLINRRNWAMEESLENVAGLANKHLKLLTANSFESVYSVCQISPDKLYTLVKGMGLQTCETVYRRCMAHVSDWERDNWTREQRGLV